MYTVYLDWTFTSAFTTVLFNGSLKSVWLVLRVRMCLYDLTVFSHEHGTTILDIKPIDIYKIIVFRRFTFYIRWVLAVTIGMEKESKQQKL